MARRLLAVPTPLLFLGSLLVAAALLWRQGTLSDLGDVARDADRRVAAVAFGLYLLGTALLAARWHLLVRMAHGTSDGPRAAEAFLTSVVVNYAAPIGLAVPTRAALTKRSLGLSTTATGVIAVWEIVADVLVLGVGALAWLAISDDGAAGARDAIVGNGQLLAAAAIIVLAVVAVGVALVLARARGRRLARRGAVAAIELLRYPGSRPVEAAWALGATIAYWLGQGLILRLLLDAVGIGGNGAWSLTLGLVSLPVLIGMLSPVPGGAGVREALMVAVAQAHGVSGAATLLAAVAYRAALFLAVPLLYVAVRAWLLGRGRTGPVALRVAPPREDA